jgi:predicted transcriptional regulator
MDKFDARQATLDLVTAFVNNNSLKSQELPALLSEVYGAIAGFGGKAVEIILSDKASTAPQEVSTIASALEPVIESENANFKAAVTIEESLRDRNFIVSMITGEKMKTLARHLRRHGLDEQPGIFGAAAQCRQEDVFGAGWTHQFIRGKTVGIYGCSQIRTCQRH